MANVPMVDAVFDGIASASEYNNVTANIRDLDTRVTSSSGTITSHTSSIANHETRLVAQEKDKILVKAVYPTQNTALTTAGTVETDIVKLAVTSLPVTSGKRYRFDYHLNMVGTLGVSSGMAFNLRTTTPVTGTIIGTSQLCNANGNGLRNILTFYYTAASTTTVSFYISHALQGGASGTVQCYQDAVYRNWVEVYDTGTPGNGIVVNVA